MPVNKDLFLNFIFEFKGLSEDSEKSYLKIVKNLGSNNSNNANSRTYILMNKKYFLEKINKSDSIYYDITFIQDCIVCNKVLNIDAYQLKPKTLKRPPCYIDNYVLRRNWKDGLNSISEQFTKVDDNILHLCYHDPTEILEETSIKLENDTEALISSQDAHQTTLQMQITDSEGIQNVFEHFDVTHIKTEVDSETVDSDTPNPQESSSIYSIRNGEGDMNIVTTESIICHKTPCKTLNNTKKNFMLIINNVPENSLPNNKSLQNTIDDSFSTSPTVNCSQGNSSISNNMNCETSQETPQSPKNFFTALQLQPCFEKEVSERQQFSMQENCNLQVKDGLLLRNINSLKPMDTDSSNSVYNHLIKKTVNNKISKKSCQNNLKNVKRIQNLKIENILPCQRKDHSKTEGTRNRFHEAENRMIIESILDKIVLNGKMDHEKISNKISDQSNDKMAKSSDGIVRKKYASLNEVSPNIIETNQQKNVNGTYGSLNETNISNKIIKLTNISELIDINAINPKHLKSNSRKVHFENNQMSYIKRNKKIFTCDICKKNFSKKNNLGSHIKIHIGERLFSCWICKTTFIQKGNLTRHMLIHTGEKRFCCKICNMRFNDKGHLNRHMMVHTGRRPFYCIVCQMRFSQKTTLEKHTRIHTGEKPYSCDICNKAFALKQNLKSHMTTHEVVQSYFCTICQKRFSYITTLKRHIKVIHEGRNK